IQMRSTTTKVKLTLSLLIVLHLGLPLVASEPPVWQYDSGEIRIARPTADEPRVGKFDANSVQSALKYLDEGSLAWTRTKNCVACHTTGAYMLDRPLLTSLFGPPQSEVQQYFAKTVSSDLPPTKEKNGITYYQQAERTVWRAAGLAEWDKYVTGTTSEVTDRALRAMMAQLSSHGGFYMPDPVEIPYETTDMELSEHAARAIVSAPGWLQSVTDEETNKQIERFKEYLRTAKPRHDYDRAIRIAIAKHFPDCVSSEDCQADLALLWGKQHADGGWSTRDMSETRNWSAHMTEVVVKLIDGLPDANQPESDPFMTALSICLLRESGIPASDERIQKAIRWLKGEQRVSGRWWMHSLYRGNYHFSTYIATSKAMHALALCDELK
ncbi:MAG: hypothetical protein U0930_10060, partial [Pirellulales bacterium]